MCRNMRVRSVFRGEPFQSIGAICAAPVLWVGGDLVKAKNTHQNHSDQWSCEEKGLPAGLKGDTLHADPLV
jgi:hypothetical protein